MLTLWFEFKLAARALLRSPGFSLAVVAILAGGLGLCMYVFGALQSFVLRPLPFAEPDRLLHMEWSNSKTRDFNAEVRLHDYALLQREQTQFEDLAGFYGGTVNLSGDAARPERFDGAFMAAAAFSALRVAPFMGRTIEAGDQAPGAAGVVLIGHDLWQQRFGADSEILGRTIRVNGRDASVIGVMPSGFRFPFSTQVWVPLGLDLSKQARGEAVTLEVFGRLKPDASPASAAAEMQGFAKRINESYPDDVQGDGFALKPYRDEFVSDPLRRIMATMFAAVVLVLLIACANVANLLLARGAARARDFAVRNSLGASRTRMVLGMLSESTLLAIIAVPIAIIIGAVGGEATLAALRASDDPPPFWMTQWSLDIEFVGVAIALALFAGVVAGLLPGLKIACNSTSQVIREASAGGTGRIGGLLVIAEIGMSVALLVAAGLLIRSVLSLQAVDSGAKTERVLTARVGLFEASHPDEAAIRSFDQRLGTRLAAIPGVESVGLTTTLPLGGFGAMSYVAAEGVTHEDPDATPLAWSVAADAGYFDTFAVPLLAGRVFSAGDGPDAERVVILGKKMAESIWPGQDPLGRRLRLERADKLDAPLYTVIGVVGDVVQNGNLLRRGADFDRPSVYVNLAQVPARFKSIALRTTGEPMAFAQAMQDAMRELDADTPLYFVRSMDDVIAAVSFDHRLLSLIFSGFGLLSLVLAGAGLYAVLAFAVAQRTREIGVRRALGADSTRVVRMVARQGARQVGIGIALGLIGAIGFAFALSSLLAGVWIGDPITYLAVALTFALVAMLATVLPVRQALRIEPIQALRYD